LGDAGSVVPVGDSAAVARVLVALLGDRDRAGAMGEAGRLRASEYYDEADVVRRYRELYTGGADGRNA
jgi:glycosyltransferase involved in cell wall biosynthesis